MAEVRFVLLESAAGYALMERKEGDEVSIKLGDVQKSVLEFGRFSKMLSLKGFLPFLSGLMVGSSTTSKLPESPKGKLELKSVLMIGERMVTLLQVCASRSSHARACMCV